LSEPVLGLIMLTIMIGAIMIGFPTAFTLMALGVIFGYLGRGPAVFDIFVQRTFGLMTNDVLIAVRLCIFMGYIIERAGTLDRLFRSILVATGPLRGSLAIATLQTCTIFATATGIVGAAVTLMGLLALPAMLRAGYDVKFAAGTIAAGGTLGILIPPSVLLILYGSVAGVGVPRLYAAAFLPGLMLSSLYLIYILARAYMDPKLAPPLPPEERRAALETFDLTPRIGSHRFGPPVIIKDNPVAQIPLMLVTSFLPLTALIGAVLGSILAGWATPTEAAALGAFGGLVLAFLYGRLRWDTFKESVYLTARTTAMVTWLFVGSGLFAGVFAILGGSKVIEEWIVGLGLPSWAFFWLAQFIIFLLGWPLEWTEITIIFMPLFLPLLDKFRLDREYFGIMAALNQQTSFLSPPVAMSAFYLKGVAPPHVTLSQIFAGMYPYMAIQCLSMVVLWFFPQLATWLPDAIYGPSIRR
jgi:TRAP-type mannitol/chloroaromatic compound transport system permease large subunit